jgi:hypothetical protein
MESLSQQDLLSFTSAPAYERAAVADGDMVKYQGVPKADVRSYYLDSHNEDQRAASSSKFQSVSLE